MSAVTTISLNGTTQVSDGNGGRLHNTWKPIRALDSNWVHQTSDGYLIDPINYRQPGPRPHRHRRHRRAALDLDHTPAAADQLIALAGQPPGPEVSRFLALS